MGFRGSQWIRRTLIAFLATMATCTGVARASATLLLEEPYGKLGFFTATGHAAVYLSGVCAETPLVLRPCNPGETGVVISRYDGVGGYDWLAIPLIPYLYAVNRPEDVPLFADARMTAFLRDQYRRKYLEDIAPDTKNGGMPGGNWYELVGSSYDRTIYGFEIPTTSKQDLALIHKLNSSPNESHFHTVSRNCADFAKDILNFYYPKALHRSVIADVGITTPKQMAKTLIKYSAHHPQVPLSRIVISQVPGSMARSSTVHGVVESFFTSKKYIVPSAVVSPIFAGCVGAVYVGTGGTHFDPARNAMVFVVGGNPEPPLDREDRRAYQLQLKHLLAGTYPDQDVDHLWGKRQSKAKDSLDAQGRPILEMEVDDHIVGVGDSAENVLSRQAPPQLVRQLLEARLESELNRRSPKGVSEAEIERDWELLEKSMAGGRDDGLSAHLNQRSVNSRGNQP
ncbi:MAG TPA: hypothetical protein VMB66_12320 [Candidatus Acidoferrales bacterium]|nr:hypothetical protein [Candidatus Acidoferrales bacterium]